MPYIEKITKSGDLLEIEKYFASRHGIRVARSKNGSQTSLQQAILNQLHAQKKLVRLINCNFSRYQKDLFVTFTYRGNPGRDKAVDCFRKLIRRIRTYCRKNGLPELKYIVFTEKQSKWHHHVIMSYVPMEALSDMWEHGRVNLSILDDMYNYQDLADYLLKVDEELNECEKEENGKARAKGKRRWSSSLNLDKPKEVKRVIRPISVEQPEAPEGYRLMPDWIVGCDIQGNLYQSYQCVRLKSLWIHKNEKPTKKGRKQARQRVEAAKRLD